MLAALLALSLMRASDGTAMGAALTDDSIDSAAAVGTLLGVGPGAAVMSALLSRQPRVTLSTSPTRRRPSPPGRGAKPPAAVAPPPPKVRVVCEGVYEAVCM